MNMAISERAARRVTVEDGMPAPWVGQRMTLDEEPETVEDSEAAPQA
jgi:hypothetical protein